MTDFKFRLTTLLRLREATRDERRVALAESHQAEKTLQRQLERLREERNSVTATLRQAAGPGAVDVERLRDAQRYQQTLETQIHHVNVQLAALASEIDRRREALLEADREVRTLEKLRDAQKIRHRHEAHRHEAKRLDEATHLRAAVGSEMRATAY